MMTGGLHLDKGMTIDTLLNLCPRLAEVFNRYGMACVGCVFSRFHTLSDAAAIYGLDDTVLLNEISHQWAALCNHLTDN